MTGSRADCLLSGLFGSPGLIKLGQGFADDLRLLKRGYPSWQAWRLMRNLVDVPLVWKCVQESAKHLAEERRRSDSATAYIGNDAGWNRPRKHRKAMTSSSVFASTPRPTGKAHGVSLAKLCCYALARPMDKAMQLSDWSMRPLSAAQQQYILLPTTIGFATRRECKVSFVDKVHYICYGRNRLLVQLRGTRRAGASLYCCGSGPAAV